MKLAVIPARGGSKRLPGKNIMPLAGKPLIQWTIDAALESGVFDRVCVSTDCETIASVARAGGADVPFLRPDALASDTATTASALAHFIQMLEQAEACSFSHVCLLQPTSPLRTAEDIREAENLLMADNLDAVVSVCELEHPIQWCNRLGPDGSMKGFVTPAANRRSQDQEPFYRLNGAIYFCRTSVALKLETLYSEDVRSRAWVMDQAHSVDIDTALDFAIAEAVIGYESGQWSGTDTGRV
ncbi:acylneuraminate cytidylyltransferase family protein [Marinobacter confluentis]|uniref:Acylneuraminate cytidylyltransferase family protein n=1 Tax=Marinobacter confluentis TaxID=1697557 RepID=A0A4Z1BQG9_9GAMM|nr:acylneuraminate cytidylyltransferase family protein [Marinobacter confluentis]TGN39925.1 acylneuraminate cytidylyltransferase family protein [Marinobacter confluentis]